MINLKYDTLLLPFLSTYSSLRGYQIISWRAYGYQNLVTRCLQKFESWLLSQSFAAKKASPKISPQMPLWKSFCPTPWSLRMSSAYLEWRLSWTSWHQYIQSGKLEILMICLRIKSWDSVHREWRARRNRRQHIARREHFSVYTSLPG